MLVAHWASKIQTGKGIYKCPVSEVAAAVGVDRSTLWRWSKRPEYQEYMSICLRLASFRIIRSAEAKIMREQREREAEEARLIAKMQR